MRQFIEDMSFSMRCFTFVFIVFLVLMVYGALAGVSAQDATGQTAELPPTPTPTALPDLCTGSPAVKHIWETAPPPAGLIADCNALLAARDTLRGRVYRNVYTRLNWYTRTHISY